jgi:uncharacterized protein YjbI with pentapeptide repeats
MEKLNTIDNPKKCKKFPACGNWRLTGAEYCWKHLRNEREYLEYLKNKIRERNNALSKFILQEIDITEYPDFRDIFAGVNLKHANLWRANLQGAILKDTHLEHTKLFDAKLQKADLSGSYLQHATLWEAKLQQADLKDAKLQWAELHHAKLHRADLEDACLQHADLWDAKFKKAILLKANIGQANLYEANLQKADLRNAELQKANLSHADLTGAKIDEYTALTEAVLAHATLDGIKGLTRGNFLIGKCFFQKYVLGKKEKKEVEKYKETYLTIKNYFIQAGRYDDASWAAYREKVLERINIYKECFNDYRSSKKALSIAKENSHKSRLKKIRLNLFTSLFKDLGRAILAFPKWFIFLLLSALCGYGESPKRAFGSAVVIVFCFAYFFYKLKMVVYASNGSIASSFLKNLYFSIITFTTIGYGDLRPQDIPPAQIIASLEGFIGVFMIALFVWTLARRYSGR